MIKILNIFQFTFLFTLSIGSVFSIENVGAEVHQVITRKIALVENKAPQLLFTGRAIFSRFPIMPSEGAVVPAVVRFEPGAYTNWHIHLHGQYLIVIDGEGRTQEWGEPIQTIREGDVIWSPPGVKHWHGGGEDTAMSHVAISPVSNGNKSVTWLESVELPKQAILPTKKEELANKTVLLSNKQLAIIPIAAFNAIGDLERLKPALQEGLKSGLTINDIKEVLSHQYAYVGFPRSLNGLILFKELLDERQNAGIQDSLGVQATLLPDNTDYYQLGTETLKYLSKGSAKRPLFEFAPVMDFSLKTHLFGYLFSRDNISYIDRELTTISTLSALRNVNNQLLSHFRVAGNLGLTQEHLQQVIDVLNTKVSVDIAKNAVLQLNKLSKQN